MDDFNIFTAVLVNSFSVYLKGYRDAAYILDGFARSFSLGLQKNSELRAVTKSLYPKELCRNVQYKVSKDGVIGLFSFTPVCYLMISTVTVVPKPNSSKFRITFSLSVSR